MSFDALILAALLVLSPPWRSYVEAQCEQIVEAPLVGLPAHAYATAELVDGRGICTVAPGAEARLGVVGLASALVHEAAHIHAARDGARLGVLRAGILAELIADRVTATAAVQHGWVYTPRDIRGLPDSRGHGEAWRTINVGVRE